MANIEVKGYVNRPETKTTGAGLKFSKFSLSEKVKDKKNGEVTVRRVFWNVTDFNSPTPPNESDYATVKGWLKVNEYTNAAGVKCQSLDIKAESIEIAPKREGLAAASMAPGGDDFGF